MKKVFYILFLTLFFSHISIAQNVNDFISEFSSCDNVQKRVIDKEMLDASLQAAKAMDPTGTIAAQIPPFMQKLDTIEIFDLTQCPADVKTDFISRFGTLQDNDEYLTLLLEDEGTDKVRVISKKDGSITTEVIILGIGNNDDGIAILKMTGKLDDSDIEEILKKPTSLTGN